MRTLSNDIIRRALPYDVGGHGLSMTMIVLGKFSHGSGLLLPPSGLLSCDDVLGEGVGGRRHLTAKRGPGLAVVAYRRDRPPASPPPPRSAWRRPDDGNTKVGLLFIDRRAAVNTIVNTLRNLGLCTSVCIWILGILQIGFYPSPDEGSRPETSTVHPSLERRPSSAIAFRVVVPRKGLERSLQAAERRHVRRLRDLAGVVEGLEGELREARTDLGRQAWKHQLLLNTKMRLEGEIARYRDLLEGEEGSLTATAAVGPRSSHTWLRQKTLTLPSVAVVMEASLEQRIETVTTQEIAGHSAESESAKAPSKVQTEKMDELIKGWECSFFKDNPHLRKKSASLRFDLHLAAAEEGSPPIKRGTLPDIELRLVMRKSSSIPSLKS
ncbi:keratin-like protein KRT222 [Hypanus sabinus]|uniref:keratin-like protein KRT222 n=1 Tax=Hypanus sabinus TaxID=79690 RepID=UPI0028C42345|nr:keratin-like protein KRT222 [Hypanus sabinus]